MTHFLAILALTRTGIDWITPESSSYLYCSFSMLNLSFVNPNSLSSLTLTAYTDCRHDIVNAADLDHSMGSSVHNIA